MLAKTDDFMLSARLGMDTIVAATCRWPVVLGCTCAVTVAGILVRRKLKEPVISAGVRQLVEHPSGSAKQQGFSNKAVPADIDVIVIGSGIGGLACAVTLAKEGRRVLVLEQHDVPGGCTHTFTEDGYEFDSGLHYVGGHVWDREKGGLLMDFVTDGALEWHHTGEVCDVSVIGGKRMDMRSGLDALRDDLYRHFPGESAAINLYFATVRQAQQMAGAFFAHKVVPAWMQWPLERLLRRGYVDRFASKTTLEVLRAIGASPALIGRLSFQWGDYGLPPGKSSFAVHAMVADHYFDGGAYPVGGPSVIARAAVRVIEQHGGTVLVRAPVERILVTESGRVAGVRVARGGGTDVLAPLVVSGAGAALTYTRLLPEQYRPSSLMDDLGKLAVPQSCAHLSLFVGLRGDSVELQLPSSNLWISPSEDHDANVARWYSLEPSVEALAAGSLPAVFITFPSAKDPSWAGRHPGRSTCHLIAEAPYRWFQEWRATRLHHRGVAYEELKRTLADKLLAVLLEHFPQCAGRVDVCELGTPLTSEHYLGAAEGASYGLAPTRERFAAEWLEPRTHVPGLYLAGQDIISGGVMGALCGGFLTAVTMDPRIAWSRLRLLATL